MPPSRVVERFEALGLEAGPITDRLRYLRPQERVTSPGAGASKGTFTCVKRTLVIFMLPSCQRTLALARWTLAFI